MAERKTIKLTSKELGEVQEFFGKIEKESDTLFGLMFRFFVHLRSIDQQITVRDNLIGARNKFLDSIEKRYGLPRNQYQVGPNGEITILDKPEDPAGKASATDK